MKETIKKALPPQSRRGKLAMSVAARLGLTVPSKYDQEYQRWIKFIEPETFLPVVNMPKREKPLFSIVVPLYNTADKYLIPLLDSITGQVFDDWELILADASTDRGKSAAIRSAVIYDERLKYHKIQNKSIAANTNQALEHAVGKYIVFCDHDDTLSPYALNEAAARIAENSKADILYSDEDKLSDDGKWRHSPFFKPDWSPHLFLNTNYTNHVSIVRADIIKNVGGLRSEFDGSQDYDLLLRLHRNSKSPLVVEHINKILYHWREAEGSTARSNKSKSYAFESGRRALQNYIDEGPVEGRVENIPNRPGFYIHKLSPKKITRAIVYVGVSDNMSINELVARRLDNLTKSEKVLVEFKTISANMIESTPENSDSTTAIFKFRVIAYPTESDWVDRLTGVLELPDVKCVAPRILTADEKRIFDMGIAEGVDSQKIPLFKGLASNDNTFIGHTEWVRDVDGLSGAVVGFASDMSKARRYNVVWSYVLFKHQPSFEHSSFFNGNLKLIQEGTRSGIHLND
jgi:glycosyltransferase involved in cell wall biosynthesis